MRSLKTRFILGVLCFVTVILIASMFFIKNNAVVDAQDGKEKCFTSVQIKEGDTLWTIAQEYATDEYVSVDAYIDEVCEANHLAGEEITEGMYLVVPYYK